VNTISYDYYLYYSTFLISAICTPEWEEATALCCRDRTYGDRVYASREGGRCRSERDDCNVFPFHALFCVNVIIINDVLTIVVRAYTTSLRGGERSRGGCVTAAGEGGRYRGEGRGNFGPVMISNEISTI
jgi:hypothetical protein